MTEVIVRTGDLLDECADVIICPANPWLNLSGGVNGEILLRGGETIQEELHAYLRTLGKPAVESGAVVATAPGPLKARQLLHVVAIDPFYDSNIDLVREAMKRAFRMAQQLGAKTVAMPALATGYGHLSFEEFAFGLLEAIQDDWSPVNHLTVVVRTAAYADCLRRLVVGNRAIDREENCDQSAER
jgi:O-acetyl-ADP-ribose deacetylase (regulator of RNase III)